MGVDVGGQGCGRAGQGNPASVPPGPASEHGAHHGPVCGLCAACVRPVCALCAGYPFDFIE